MGKDIGATGFVQHDDKVFGNHRGMIVDNVDPLQAGRVRVKIYPFFKDVETDIIPWAIPAYPLFEGSGSDVGSFAVPKIGTWVWTFFEQGSIYQPVYFAEAPTATKGLPASRTTNYPNRKVMKTTSGVEIIIDDTAKSIKLKTPNNIIVEIDDTTSYMNLLHPTGAFIKIDELGEILIQCLNLNVVTTGTGEDGNATINIDGNVAINVNGNTQLASVGNTTISGSNVDINP